MRKSVTHLALLLLLAVPFSAGSTDHAETVVNLRFEADEKEKALEALRSRISSERYALEAQVADLEILLEKERVRKRTLKRLAKRQNEARAHQQAETARFEAPARTAAATLRAHIEASLPFNRSARLEAVDHIVTDLDGGKTDAATGLSRLWRIVEDEVKLLSEVGVHRQAVTVNGEQRLADVARVGMALLYFRVSDDSVGKAVRAAEGSYSFEETTGEEEVGAIKRFFEALEKQIRHGTFALPLPEMIP